MKIEKIQVDPRNKIGSISGTGGYQPKYSCGDKFVKVQARIGGYYVDDWIVEVAASKIGKQLKLSIVDQKPCLVFENNSTIGRFGVMSDNFENGDIHFVSLKRLCGDDWPDVKYNRLDIYDKMRYIAMSVEQRTGIKAEKYMTYLMDTVIIDLMVCNVDRHFRNLGVMHNQKEDIYAIPLIFDCGMGLFVHEPSLVEMAHGILADMIDYCYIEPYSESPLDLANYLINHSICNKYIETLRKRLGKRGLVALKDWFPSIQAYQYFQAMRKKLMLGA